MRGVIFRCTLLIRLVNLAAVRRMYRVLIISYYFPPGNGVGSWRPYSWFKHFPDNNIQTTVITRHWNGNEKLWDDWISENNKSVSVERFDDSVIVRLPYKYSALKKIVQSRWFRISGLSKLAHLLLEFAGRFSIEIDACHAFKKYITEYLKENNFDAILVSSPPLNTIRLAHELSLQYNIPFIADFRDLWTNDELIVNYNPELSRKIRNGLIKFYLKKWLKNAAFVTTVSSPLAKKISGLTTKETLEITNGFEQELFHNQSEKPRREVFTVSVIGTLHPKQDITVMIKGFKKFLGIVPEKKVRLNFIGVEAFKSVADEIKKRLPGESIFATPRISREEAIRYTMQSHVLFYPGWKNYQGIYSGKIFDYLGARRNILIAPGDDDVIDNIVLKTGAGKISNSADELCDALMQWYDEWEKAGELIYFGKDELINKYTREGQAKILAAKIKSVLDKQTKS